MPASLNFLHRQEDYQVIWFHDSFGVIDDVVRAVDRRSYLIFSFSWYADVNGRVLKIFDAFSAAIAAASAPHLVPDRVLFLMNSTEELKIAKDIGAHFHIALVNNTCFLDTNIYNFLPNSHKMFDAVCNAKALAFKRHELTEKIANKCFITYDSKEQDYGMTAKVDLRALNPASIVADVGARDVVEALNRSHVGLILSAEEGACYASTEYLLCGLPVVSTASRGGRAEFYTPENSIEVPADADAVRDGVLFLRDRLCSGGLRPQAIRQGTIARIEEFRSNFLVALEKLLWREPSAAAVRSKTETLMQKHSKMVPYRNWFKSSVQAEAGRLVCS